MEQTKMKGQYAPFSDDYGIVGWNYECPVCNHRNESFTGSETSCEECNFSEPFKDPDDWYDEQMALPVEQRAWNLKGENIIKPNYLCSNCGMAVIVIPNEKPVKACKCENATIIANMEATVIRASGGVKA